MKKLLLIIPLILLLVAPCFAQFDLITCSNLVLNTGNYATLNLPTIKWTFYDPATNLTTYTMSVTPQAFSYDRPLLASGTSQFLGLDVGGNVLMRSNVTINGTLSYGGAIVWNTNLVETTNASFVFYPTNTQSLIVDMTRPYGDLDSAISVAFTDIIGKSLTNYQTAVVLLRNTANWPSNTNTLAIVLPGKGEHSKGALYVTNETAITWFYNPHVPSTNVICLPIW